MYKEYRETVVHKLMVVVAERVYQAGALLGCGIVNSGVRNECDPALALLSDYIMNNSTVMRIGSILG